MNVTSKRGGKVHFAVSEEITSPKCNPWKGTANFKQTDAEVDCKTCLARYAEEAEAEAPAEEPEVETPEVEEPKAQRRELSAARVDEEEPEIPEVAEAPEPKVKRRRRTRPTTKETKVIASKKILDSEQAVPAGTRWIRRNRLGSLVASVDLWQHSGDDGGPRWGAMCLTHGTTARHETHRDAWKTLPKSNEWCEGCREA